jgi:SAM-dependent methyltransferase
VITSGQETGPVLSEYDTEDVDYLSYWTARSYEHRAEVMALSRLLDGRRFGHAVDVGGGYGRLSVTLSECADRVTLTDPSYRQLEVAERYLDGHPTIDKRLTDAAQLDFADASVDLAVMVRVLHHLPDPVPELAQVARIVKVGGYAIIEAANVKHAVNRIRYWREGRSIPAAPVDIRSAANKLRGSIPFVNHHPATITRQLADCGLQVERVLSVSNLRQPVLKRLLPERFMLAAEYALQVPLAPLSFGPSLFFMARKSA